MMIARHCRKARQTRFRRILTTTIPLSMVSTSIRNAMLRTVPLNAFSHQQRYFSMTPTASNKYPEGEKELTALDEAETVLKQRLENNDNDGAAYCGLGAASLRRFTLTGDTIYQTRALEYINKSLEIDENFGDAHFFMGEYFQTQGNTESAKNHFQKAKSLNTQYIQVYTKLGLCYMKIGNNQKSEHYFREAIKIDPGNGNHWNNLGGFLMKIGKTTEAENAFLKSIEYPQTSIYERITSYFNLGNIYYMKSNYEDSAHYYKKVVEGNPRDSEAQMHLGLALEKLGKDEEALEHLNSAVLVSPNHFEMNLNIGLVYEKLEKFEEATMNFKKALRINPKETIIYIHLANVAMKQNSENDLAIDYLKQAIEANNLFGEAHYQLGLIYYRQGDIQEATGYLQTAIRLNPTYRKKLENEKRSVNMKTKMARKIKIPK
eukprot:TRINITY_DN12250_c0_g1_i1.p1 TRINITY_DN12250_c0_g1~~TRINITY_DN12250_c0_g1_i1.p1  ORF type:complete len:433 (+),score=104.45 TRINITY_DN12250_c0_g1_i1:246-1544(+)